MAASLPPQSPDNGATTDTAGAEGAELAAIRDEIEQTRDEMSETLNALEAKLSPERLVAQAKDTVREEAVVRADQVKQAVRDTAQTRAAQVRRIARNLLYDLRSDAETLKEELPRRARRLREQTPDNMRGQLREVQRQLPSRLRRTRESARVQAQAALDQCLRWRDENPQAFQRGVGVASAALAVLGAWVALSRRNARRTRAALAAESVRMNARDLRDTTRDAMQDNLEAGADAARKVGRVARSGRRAMRAEARAQGLLDVE